MLSWILGYPHNLCVLRKLEDIMANLQALQAAVEKEKAVTQSALTLIQGLAQKIQDASGDQAALDALVAELNTQADSLAAAVSANTPAA